jgi:hypothetical protein
VRFQAEGRLGLKMVFKQEGPRQFVSTAILLSDCFGHACLPVEDNSDRKFELKPTVDIALSRDVKKGFDGNQHSFCLLIPKD